MSTLKQKLRTFEELRGTNQTLAKSIAMSTAIGYFSIGCRHTTRALETDAPSIELLHQARLHYQASLGALEYMGVATNPSRYAEYLWVVGQTWKYEGMVSKDPTAYQSTLQEYWDMLHESRDLQEQRNPLPNNSNMMQYEYLERSLNAAWLGQPMRHSNLLFTSTHGIDSTAEVPWLVGCHGTSASPCRFCKCSKNILSRIHCFKKRPD